MGDNMEFGSKEKYPQLTSNLNREILDWLKSQIMGPPGPPGSPGEEGDPGSPGANAPFMQVQYSADTLSWHNVPLSTDKYMHICIDGSGTNWSDAILIQGGSGIKGDDANGVDIKYSSNNIDWYDIPQIPTNYIKFSLDGGSSWEPSFQVTGSEGAPGTDANDVEIEFSANGSDWHSTFNSGVDTYIRFRVNGVDWLVEDVFIGTDGTDGDDGAAAFLYIAYASDENGTDFTETFNSALNYIGILATNIEIPSRDSSHFVGLWKMYKGQTGTAGANSYTYIAYADDSSGTGFTNIFDESKNWIAILSTNTHIATPIVSDFVGLWKNYKGAAGSNAEYIELPSNTTVALRCDAIIEQPAGWFIDSADNLSNPLSSNGLDLVIQHNVGKEVIGVIIKSKTVDKSSVLIGNAAYSLWEDDDTMCFLCIKSLATELTKLSIYITFAS